MSTPTFNPEERCPACTHPWGIADEACDYCGFDPVNNEEDAKVYEDAIALYKQMQQHR